MRASGWILIGIGGITLAVTLAMDPSVASGSSRVINIGLTASRQIAATIGSTLVLGGIVLLAAQEIVEAIARSTITAPGGTARPTRTPFDLREPTKPSVKIGDQVVHAIHGAGRMYAIAGNDAWVTWTVGGEDKVPLSSLSRGPSPAPAKVARRFEVGDTIVHGDLGPGRVLQVNGESIWCRFEGGGWRNGSSARPWRLLRARPVALYEASLINP